LGLKVKFSKRSSLIGINFLDSFLVPASSLLKCKVVALPCPCLGLPVGAISKKMETWKSVIDTLEKMLGSWRNRFASLGRRVVLIISVLASIPIFLALFFKNAYQSMEGVGRNPTAFLLGGGGEIK